MPGHGRSFAPSRYQIEAKESTDPARLEVLSQRKSSFVRSAVAQNEHTAPDTLLRLGEGEDQWVRRAVAYNAHTPEPLLRRLAGDPFNQVRKAVARNRTTAPDVLAMLAGDLSVEVRAAVAWNWNCPPEALAALATDMDPSVRRSVAKNPSTDNETLQSMVSDDSPWVRDALTARNFNPDAPTRLVTMRRFNGRRTETHTVTRRVETGGRFAPELIRKFAASSDERLQFRAAAQPDAPEDVLLSLADSPKELTRRIIAENRGASAEVLRAVLRGEAEVLKIVAVHPNADEDVLTRLATSRFPSVHAVLAFQREGGLAWMAHHRDPKVRKVAAKHLGSDGSGDLLAALIDDPDQDVQVAAAEVASQEMLARQVASPSARVRRVVAERTWFPEVLGRLSSDSKATVRRAVAMNPRVPASTLAALAGDRAEQVRAAASERFMAALGGS